MRLFLGKIAVFGLFFFFSVLFADTKNSASQATAVGDCVCGACPLILHNFDYTRNSFDINFHIWWYFKNPFYKPHKSIDIINASNFRVDKYFFSKSATRTDTYVGCAKIVGTIKNKWNMTYFPFDRHVLSVRMEDLYRDKRSLNFVCDTRNSTIASRHFFIRNEWNLIKYSVKSIPHVYNGTAGLLDADNKNAALSQFVMQFEIKRNGFSFLITHLLYFHLAFFFTIAVFLMNAHQMSHKLGLIGGAIYAAVTNRESIDVFLPVDGPSIVINAIQYSSFSIIILATVASIFLYNNTKERGYSELAIKKVSTKIVWIISFLHIGVMTTAILTAYFS